MESPSRLSLKETSMGRAKNRHCYRGSHLKSTGLCTGNRCVANSSFKTNREISRRQITVQASYSDGGKLSSEGIFIGGFVLGGIFVATLGAIYVPQISKALAGSDKKDLMRKLPKFVYEEDNALEGRHKILLEKIEQLNSAIDDVSAQLRIEDSPNGAAIGTYEVEAV